jgi:hypothetical protein
VFFAMTLLIALMALNLIWISADAAELFDWADLFEPADS